MLTHAFLHAHEVFISAVEGFEMAHVGDEYLVLLLAELGRNGCNALHQKIQIDL